MKALFLPRPWLLVNSLSALTTLPLVTQTGGHLCISLAAAPRLNQYWQVKPGETGLGRWSYRVLCVVIHKATTACKGCLNCRLLQCKKHKHVCLWTVKTTNYNLRPEIMCCKSHAALCSQQHSHYSAVYFYGKYKWPSCNGSFFLKQFPCPLSYLIRCRTKAKTPEGTEWMQPGITVKRYKQKIIKGQERNNIKTRKSSFLSYIFFL